MAKEILKDIKQYLLLKGTNNNIWLIMIKNEQIMSFAVKEQEEKVLKLKKVLYDLKQALKT
ncbi:hypothetical protein CR513_50157, partial [Mucuna pruriens]